MSYWTRYGRVDANSCPQATQRSIFKLSKKYDVCYLSFSYYEVNILNIC